MRRSELSINYILVLGLEAALALLLGIGWLGEALSPRKLAGLALILAGVMSLRLEGRPSPAVTVLAGSAPGAPAASVPAPVEGRRETTPQEAPDSRSPTGRRPCQNTNHAPCR
jgi:drug/metabolite transporter (DMT)-like permease